MLDLGHFGSGFLAHSSPIKHTSCSVLSVTPWSFVCLSRFIRLKYYGKSIFVK